MLKSLLTRQNISLALLLGGGGWFLQRVAELLSKHTAWSDFATPPGTGEVVALVGSALTMAAGALGLIVKAKPE